MRVPVQSPALLRSHQSRLVRRFGRGRMDADGVRLSQYEGGEEGEGGEEEEGGDSGGGETNEEGDASVESE